LLPLQILFLNMITDVFPALALGMGKGDKLVMKNKPRNPADPIISNKQWQSIIYYAGVITLSIVAGVIYCHRYLSSDPVICNNVVFLSLALGQLWHVFNMKSSKSGIIRNEITKNPYVWIALALCFGFTTATVTITPLSKLLHIQAITYNIGILCTIISVLPLIIIQSMKKIF
jgi:P-type Ca2+ transporter type 2C